MKKRFNLVSSLLIAVTLAGCAGQSARKTEAPIREKSTVAVLEFENHSLGSAEAARGIGRVVADRVTETLSGRPGLRLIDRESLQKVLEELSLSSRDLVRSDEQLKLGKLLGAHYLIAGGVMAVGETLRIDGRIIEVERGVAEGASVEGTLKERETLERNFSVQVADQISARIGDRGPAPKTARDYFLQGLRFEGVKDRAQALQMYQKALSVDPKHPEARERMEQLLLEEIQ